MRNTQRSNSRGCFLALLLGCFLLPSLSLAATVTYASNKVMGPTDGLVGYWTMNAQDINWTTGTVLDRSGLGNNGILTNMATKTAPYIGKIGQALRFDAADDVVNTGSASSLDDLPQMTISLWIHELGNGENFEGHAIDKSTGSTPTGGWQLRAQGSVGFIVRTTGGNMNLSTNNTPLADHQWHHLLVTWDGGILATGAQLFIDGRQATNTIIVNGSGSRTSDASYNLVLGNNPATTRTLNGSLDEVRIYNRILSPTEIKQLYTVGQVQLNSVSKKSTSGLVGWWTFDGQDLNWTTGTALDRSGYGNNGILTNMATKTSPAAGKLGQGLKFVDTSNNQVVNAGSATNIDDIQNLTISAWVKPSTATATKQPTLIAKMSSCISELDGWRLFFDGLWSGKGRYTFTRGYTIQKGQWQTGMIDSDWHHVSVTYDYSSSANDPTFYIDGVATSSTEISTPSGTQRTDGAQPLTLGNCSIFSKGAFGGTLDDVRIYNRILTPTEVAKLYKEGQVTVNTFKCGVSTVKDVDGNVYNTVKIGTQCWMKQNMRVGTRINVAGNQTNNGIIEKYCYNDTASNCTANNPNYPDGGLYRWNEAMQYSTTPGARGICPAGWHIPTHNELTTLERAVCTSGSCVTDFPYDESTNGTRGTNEGTKLKANGTSGFEGNLSGYSFLSFFSVRSVFGQFWSSTESGQNAWVRGVNSGYAQVYRDLHDKTHGLSVRCLQN